MAKSASATQYNAYYVSADGGSNVPKNRETAPTPAQCAANRNQSTNRAVHFTSIEAAIRCMTPPAPGCNGRLGDVVVVNGQTAGGAKAVYDESGFGQTKPLPPVGSTCTRTGTVSVDSPAVVLSGSASGIAPGMGVWGDGIAEGSVVRSVAGSTVVLDQLATGSRTATPLTFAAMASLVGRCNADIATGNQVFDRDSCKPKIQPSPTEWGKTTAANSWQAAGPDRRSIFYTNTPRYLSISNFDFDASNIGAKGPDGVWDGTICNCLAASVLSLKDDSPGNATMGSYVIVRNSSFRSIPAQAIIAVSIKGGSDGMARPAHLAVISNRFINNGQNYQASQAVRFGSYLGSPSCPGAPTVCDSYWAHVHDLYIGASDVGIEGNRFENTAGGSLQLSNSSFLNEANIRIARNFWLRSGWKSKQSDNSPNASVGPFQFSNGVVINLHVENNIIFNSTNVFFGSVACRSVSPLTDCGAINNNTFVAGSPGVLPAAPPAGVFTPAFAIHNSYALAFYNNLLCFGTDANGGPDNSVTVSYDTLTSAQITDNGQLGLDLGPLGLSGTRTFSRNDHNVFNCPARLFARYGGASRAAGPSDTAEPSDFVPASTARDVVAGAKEAPKIDFSGALRTSSDAGALRLTTAN